MNTLLNKSDVIYLLAQQEKLDEAMRAEHKIKKHDWLLMMEREHRIALNVEVHEFLNSCFKAWKYWKKKDMVMADVIDEAIDVIHFCMLELNKQNVKTEWTADRVVNEIDSRYPLKDRKEVKSTMYALSVDDNSAAQILADVLIILDYYGFTTLDVLKAYNDKNEVNFERLNNGY